MTKVLGSKGGRTPLNTKMSSLSTCTHTLASIKVDVNDIKLKKEGTLTDREARIKIEILVTSFLRDCQSGVVKSSSQNVNCWE